MAHLECLWCGRELTEEEFNRGDLCSACEQVSTGIPDLSEEQLNKLPFGVIQVNREGIILSYNEAEHRLSGLYDTDIVGHNFFTEIAPCADVQEFKGRFDDFLNSSELSVRFDFTYRFNRRDIEVQITFLRVNHELAFVLSRRVSV